MKRKKTFLSVVTAFILSLSIVGATSAAASVPHYDWDGSGSVNPCIKSGKCARP